MLFLTELRIELNSTGIIFLSLELKCDSYFNLYNGNFKSSHPINLAGNRIHQMLTLYLVFNKYTNIHHYYFIKYC